jgi:hypothetical protein
MIPTGSTATTYTYGDCHAVMGRNQTGGGPPTWTFTWNAPSDGATVTMYYGVVDGDCMMDSMNDDVKVGVKKLGGGMAMNLRRDDARGADRGLGMLGFLPALGALAIAIGKRRAR